MMDVATIETYSDASHMYDWQKSQLGVVCFLCGAPVAWRTTTSTLAAASTCESELQAAVLGAQITMGLGTLVEDLGLRVEMWQGIDNQAALAVLHDTSSWRTRHLAIRSAVLRDLVRDGVLKTSHVRSQEQLADGLTKFLRTDLHLDALRGWGMMNLSDVMMPSPKVKMMIENGLKDFDADAAPVEITMVSTTSTRTSGDEKKIDDEMDLDGMD